MAETDDILTLFVGPEEGDEEMPAPKNEKPAATSAEDILKQIRDLCVTYFGESQGEEPEPEEEV